MRDTPEHDQLLSPRDVAAIFNVTPRTVTRWAMLGQLESVKTPGGHRRYRERDVRAFLGHEDN